MNATHTRSDSTPARVVGTATTRTPAEQMSWRTGVRSALAGNRWMVVLITTISLFAFLALITFPVLLLSTLSAWILIPLQLKTMTAGYRALGVPRTLWLTHLRQVTAVLCVPLALPVTASAILQKSLFSAFLLVLVVGFYLVLVTFWAARIWPADGRTNAGRFLSNGGKRSKWTDWTMHSAVREPKSYISLSTTAYVQWWTVGILLLVMVVIVPVMQFVVSASDGAADVFLIATSAGFGGSFAARGANVAVWFNLGGGRLTHWKTTVKKLLPIIPVATVVLVALASIVSPDPAGELAAVTAGSLKVGTVLFTTMLILTYVQYGQRLAAYGTAGLLGIAGMISVHWTHPAGLCVIPAAVVIALVVSRKLAMNYDNTRGDYNPQNNTRGVTGH